MGHHRERETVLASKCWLKSDDGSRCRNKVVTVDPRGGGLCQKHADTTVKWVLNEREAARLIWAMRWAGLLPASGASA